MQIEGKQITFEKMSYSGQTWLARHEERLDRGGIGQDVDQVEAPVGDPVLVVGAMFVHGQGQAADRLRSQVQRLEKGLEDLSL